MYTRYNRHTHTHVHIGILIIHRRYIIVGALLSGLDQQGLGIMTVIREWTGNDAPKCTSAAEKLKDRVKVTLPHDNVLHLHVEYRNGSIDADYDVHDEYLGKFRELILDRLQQLVNASVEADPEIKSRKKMVQEVYAESMAHFALLRELPLANESDEIVERVKKLILAGTIILHLQDNNILWRKKDKKTDYIYMCSFVYS